MKRLVTISILMLIFQNGKAQTQLDSMSTTGSLVIQDRRLTLLGKEMNQYNESLSLKTKMVDGFRLIILKTSDREEAMKLRSTLLRVLPDQKLYMIFVSPNIKLKMGNFTERTEAEKMRKWLLEQKIVSGNIYIVPEKVELKPIPKTNEPE
ncbi:MAG: hypothetical protein RIR96_1356 [Bacteroidota bacterium]